MDITMYNEIENGTWIKDRCTHPSHNPPMHIVITGVYIHRCPSCGHEVKIVEPKITWAIN